MNSASLPAMYLLAVAAVGAFCWIPLLVYRLSLARGIQRQFLLPPVLLALASFVPLAVALTSITRAGFDVPQPTPDATQLNWVFGGLYLFGVAALFVMSNRGATTSALNRSIFVLVVVYWLAGAMANYSAGLALARFSFLVLPLVFLAAWRLRASYRDAIGILTYATIATCAASLILAALEPSVAFTDPTRSATFLFTDRLAGIFEHPNILGLFASTGSVLAWRSGRWTRLIGSPICVLALIASDSRESWFACAAAIAILLAGSRHSPNPDRSRPSGKTGGPATVRFLLGGSLILLVAAAIPTLAVPHGDVSSFTVRTEVWQFVLQHWTESPIIGHGPGIWSSLVAGGQVPAFVNQAHDQFFETLYTTGVVGVIILVALLCAWTVKSMRAARDGYWLPLALEVLIVAYGVLESPLTLAGIEPDLWLISIVLFLDPVEDVLRGVEDTRASPRPRELLAGR